MVTTSSKPITLEEFLELPETKPASEYIDGKIIQKPMPKGKHSTIQGELTTALNNSLKPKKIARASCSIASTRRSSQASGETPEDATLGTRATAS